MIETIYNIISQYILLPLTIAVFPVDYQTEAMLFFQTTIKILAIVDLPLPLSPTTPTISPELTW